MKHPNQATLALHAGGDLGPVRRWIVAQHLAHCAPCREEVARFDEVRQMLPDLAELPEISWSGLEAEIKANVRLGLEAGECVRDTELPLRGVGSMGGWRTVVAFASVLVLIAGCMMLERPVPVKAAGPLAETTSTGVQVHGSDGQTLGLMNGSAEKVTYTMDAQGSVGARYIDPETGSVTINTVYAQ